MSNNLLLNIFSYNFETPLVFQVFLFLPIPASSSFLVLAQVSVPGHQRNLKYFVTFSVLLPGWAKKRKVLVFVRT